MWYRVFLRVALTSQCDVSSDFFDLYRIEGRADNSDKICGHGVASWPRRVLGLALVFPITSQPKGYPFEVKPPESGKVTGVVRSDRLRSLDWRTRRAKLIYRVPESVFQASQAKFRTLV